MRIQDALRRFDAQQLARCNIYLTFTKSIHVISYVIFIRHATDLQ